MSPPPQGFMGRFGLGSPPRSGEVSALASPRKGSSASEIGRQQPLQAGTHLLQQLDVKALTYDERLQMALRLFQGLPNHYVSYGKEYLNMLLSRDFLSDLPCEIAIYILSFTSEDTVAKCSMVCKSWYKICNDNLLWKKV